MIVPVTFNRIRAYENTVEGEEVVGWELDKYDTGELAGNLRSLNHRLHDWLMFRFPNYATRIVHMNNDSGLMVIAIYPSQQAKAEDRLPVYNLICKFQASIYL